MFLSFQVAKRHNILPAHYPNDAKPFCVRMPRTIPFAFRDKLKAELDLLQEQNIIAPVTEPTDWCAPIVVTPKKGKPPMAYRPYLSTTTGAWTKLSQD